ncbi:hypothetical protein [Mycolicibacterium fortuitum]|uniref:hypothetical protein n=1 Tax=Mycolicibacterium fortuitum TaxID=1766 RepID=UPI00261B560F|nr:hypothetical protein [Mycolicibacterium fortuitum]
MSNGTTTTTFREYPSYAGNLYLSVDTNGTTAKLAVRKDDQGEPVVAELDANTARDLATAMIAFNGSCTAWTVEPLPYGDLYLDVQDGQVFLTLPGFTPFDLGEGECDPFVHDLGQRLIVWAGVAEAA